MQPLIQAHTAGPRPLAGAGGGESILQHPGTLSAPGGWGAGGVFPRGLPPDPSALWEFGVLGSPVWGKAKVA